MDEGGIILKKSIKKVLTASATVALLAIPNVLCFASTKTYNTTFSFSGCILGKERSYKFGDITVTTESKQKTWGTLYEDTFSVSLYQTGLMLDTYVGKYEAKCEGTTIDGWTNIPSGTYRLQLDKNKRDGQLLEGTMKIVNTY